MKFKNVNTSVIFELVIIDALDDSRGLNLNRASTKLMKLL